MIFFLIGALKTIEDSFVYHMLILLSFCAMCISLFLVSDYIVTGATGFDDKYPTLPPIENVCTTIQQFVVDMIYVTQTSHHLLFTTKQA